VAVAGSDLDWGVNVAITLSGSDSYSPSATPLTYAWTLVEQPANSNAVLSSANTNTTTLIPDEVGIYKVKLIVNNEMGTSDPDTVVLNVLENITAVDEHSGEAIRVFPNPADDVFSIENARDEAVDISMFDMKGSLVRTFAITQDKKLLTISINQLGLRPGLYFIRIQGQKKSFFRRILVLEK
jgi:hypothetical protein